MEKIVRILLLMFGLVLGWDHRLSAQENRVQAIQSTDVEAAPALTLLYPRLPDAVAPLSMDGEAGSTFAAGQAAFGMAFPQSQQGQQPAALPQKPVYTPITGAERFRWAITSTVGPRGLAMGVLSSSWGTMLNRPEEYGPGWEGFGKRYGMRLTGISTGNAMEAAGGAILGEDPRYFRSGGPFGTRVKNIVKMTFYAHRRDGTVAPAYARMGATLGNNFLSGTWRVESEKGADQALLRSGWGILGRMGGNALTEFWPDMRRLISRKPAGNAGP